MKKLRIILILLLCSLTFGIMTGVLADTNTETVKINYILEETNLSITFNTEVVDKEIGNGRVWITSLEDVQAKNPAFVAPANKTFIGWEYKSSVQGGGLNYSSSAYKAGDHFTQNEYYSLSENETEINIVPVWGYTVYVDGTNGCDDNDGSISNPVRTIGRAYEVLARLDSNNPNANITGFTVTGDSKSGFSYGASDTANLVTNFNGRIVLKSNVNYKDEYEGRYEYITYGDLINSANYNASTGVTTFDDGVSSKSFTNLKAATGYSESDPVKLSKSGSTYKVMAKTASGSYHYMLKKVLNNYSYTYNGTTYYTYGRLTQYTENLRAHVGKGLMSPKNDGLVLITANDGVTNYGSLFEFGDYTRYASGGDLIYKDIKIAFFHNSSLDKESHGYVCGYAANGNYLAIDEGVTSVKDSTHINPSIYGGGHGYRYNSNNYSGTGGNNLGDAGSSTLTNTRLTVKSGTWYGGYNGSYGQKVGLDVAVGGYTENNASVINIYGGTYSLGIGMGNEGASSINSYVYVYGGTMPTVHGSGLGSSGAMTGKGKTNVLITGANTKISSAVFGGSTNGTHTGDIYFVIKNGTINGLVYGGCQKTSVTGNITITITGGTMKGIIGGCATGSVTGKVTVNVHGGNINGDIYTSGQGGTQEDNRQFYTGGQVDSTLNSQILDKNDSRLNLLITGDSSADSEAIIAAAKSTNSSANKHHNDKKLTVGGVEYYYPQMYSSDYTKLLTGYVRGTYGNHGVTQYTMNSRTAYLSLATVKGVELNITGGEIKGNIYGGGKVSVVEGNVNINISNAKITGNVYGGGDGSYEPTVNLYIPTGTSTTSTQSFTWKGSDTFNINEYDPVKNLPIDWENKYVYSPTYDYMGGVNGDVTINLSENTNITGNVYGGGNEGLVTGTVIVNMNDTAISNAIYGGGNVGHVSQNTQITLNGVTVKNVFGGGYSGRIEGSTSLNLSNSNITEVFGGGYAGNINGGTTILINSGTYTNVFAGCDKAVVAGNTKVNVGSEEEGIINITGVLYGGGRGIDNDSDGDASDFTTVVGDADVTITGLKTKVENYGSTKLGTVNGDVDVTFKDYWTGNTTNKYKVMNGIDRATNVYFENAYVLLENKDANGNLEGIKDITNLYIPNGSGIKVSATGEILGDFHGGGTFYLDSEVCLNIRGNIYGESLIVLNPVIVEDINLIKGSEDYPYMRIYGEDASNGFAIYSQDPKYTILHGTESSGASIYYIERDVIITESITNDLINTEGKHYTDDVSGWDTKDFYVVDSGCFSTDCNIEFIFVENEEEKELYESVIRKLALYTGDNLVPMPAGTSITMISNGKYYKYNITSALSEVKLDLFEDMENSSSKYVEITDIKSNASLDSGNELKKQYIYKENFRFIVDFSGVPETERLSSGPYNLVLNYYDAGAQVETSNRAVNIVMIDGRRKYNLKYILNREWYENGGEIDLNLKMTAEYSNAFKDEDALKSLVALISIKDENGEYIELPSSIKFYVDGNEIQHTNGNAMYTVAENLVQTKMEIINQLKIDLSNLSGSLGLATGKKTICIDYYLAKDGVLEENVEKYEIETEIKKFLRHSLVCIVEPENGQSGNDLLTVKRSVDNTRKILMNYIGDLIDPEVTVRLEIKNGDAFYSTSNIKSDTKYDMLLDNNSIDVVFENIMSAGTYRVAFDLVDRYGEKKATESIIFICE